MSDVERIPERPLSAVITQQLLAYVERVVGPQGVDEVLARAGLTDRRDELVDDAAWCASDDALALAAAAEQVCGDPDIGRRVGEQLWYAHRRIGLTEFHLAAGSVVDAIATGVDYGSRMGVGRRSTMRQVGERHVVVESVYDNPDADERYRFFCAVQNGYYARLPTTFGADGTATESSCQLLGADRCVMHVTWDGGHVTDEAVAAGATRADETIRTYEVLHQMAADLAAEDDISTLLDKLVERAGMATLAPRTLLAVQLPGERRLRVHQSGFPAAAAEAVAHDVLAGTTDPRWGDALVSSVASPTVDYGRLAVFVSADSVRAPGGLVDRNVRRMVEAYANHATAAISAKVALVDARRNRDTAEALLDLARSLTSVGDNDETARRLVHAVRSITGASVGRVWLWDPERRRTIATAAHPEGPHDPTLPFPLAEIPELQRLAQRQEPLAIAHADASPQLAATMAAAGSAYLLAVPVAANGAFLGVITAGYEAVPELDDGVLDHLQGVADQGAAALENSRLLEQVRHQALHDPLTGLPNRALAEDRGKQALARAARLHTTVAMLFIDLDRFKEVNDSLGHPAGDELLRQVARRLSRCVRGADTVARLAGDEFLVVLPELPDVASAEAAAHKVRHALATPLEVGDDLIHISASVGIACAPDDGSDYDQLLLRADAAMYAAKDLGRDAVVTYAATGRR